MSEWSNNEGSTIDVILNLAESLPQVPEMLVEMNAITLAILDDATPCVGGVMPWTGLAFTINPLVPDGCIDITSDGDTTRYDAWTGQQAEGGG